MVSPVRPAAANLRRGDMTFITPPERAAMKDPADTSRTFSWCPALEDPWRQVLAVQRDLVRISHHRGPSPMDVLIVLTAQERRLTLLHADSDVESVAKVRPGLAMIRVDQPPSA